MFNATAANFASMLDGVGGDLEHASNLIDAEVTGTGGQSPSESFYRIKGTIYAEFLVLEGFAKDFAAPLASHNLLPAWTRMMSDLKAAAGIRSGAVRGGSPGVAPSPCDLCTQGFFILRARIAMAHIAETLRK